MRTDSSNNDNKTPRKKTRKRTEFLLVEAVVISSSEMGTRRSCRRRRALLVSHDFHVSFWIMNWTSWNHALISPQNCFLFLSWHFPSSVVLIVQRKLGQVNDVYCLDPDCAPAHLLTTWYFMLYVSFPIDILRNFYFSNILDIVMSKFFFFFLDLWA